MKQFMGSRKQTSNLVGGHIIRTALRYCKIFGKKHKVWQCGIFKNMSKQQRWDTAKTHKLCFCCLEEGHKVVERSGGSTFNIDCC